MRPSLPSTARARRPSRLLAVVPLLLAGTLGGCIAGEAMDPGGAGAIPGRYVLESISSGTSETTLPIIVDTDNDGHAVALTYGTLDIYDDGTYVEIYKLEVLSADRTETLNELWDEGNGSVVIAGTKADFTVVLRPGIFDDADTFSGYQGDPGGGYSFNITRATGEETTPTKMHYRRW